MIRLVYILFIPWLVSCTHSSNMTPDKEQIVDSVDSTVITDTVSTLIQPPPRKLSVIVLPPFDKIANEGISPDVQKYLEREISKDTSLNVIKFPYRALMNVPYQNVFDKKYCKPITDKVDADIIVMTKLELKVRTGQMTSDTWGVSFRIYNVRTDDQ